MSGGKAKLEERATASSMGPMPRPTKEKTPEPDLLSMIKRDYQLGKACTFQCSGVPREKFRGCPTWKKIFEQKHKGGLLGKNFHSSNFGGVRIPLHVFI
jgi:hypothetical protein